MDYGQKVRELREQYPFDTSNVNAIFNFTRRVAWELRAEGFGLMEKSYGGENEVEYKGTKYSLSRIATRDRHYKILTDAGPNGANGATWVDEGPLPDRAGVSFKPALPPDGVDGPIVEIPADDDRVAALERAFQTMGEVFQRFVGTVAEKISRQDEKLSLIHI